MNCHSKLILCMQSCPSTTARWCRLQIADCRLQISLFVCCYICVCLGWIEWINIHSILSFTGSFTHSFTYSPVHHHSLAHSLTHSLTLTHHDSLFHSQTSGVQAGQKSEAKTAQKKADKIRKSHRRAILAERSQRNVMRSIRWPIWPIWIAKSHDPDLQISRFWLFVTLHGGTLTAFFWLDLSHALWSNFLADCQAQKPLRQLPNKPESDCQVTAPPCLHEVWLPWAVCQSKLWLINPIFLQRSPNPWVATVYCRWSLCLWLTHLSVTDLCDPSRNTSFHGLRWTLHDVMK